MSTERTQPIDSPELRAVILALESEAKKADKRRLQALLGPLRRLLRGRNLRDVHASFGAPGDWGYHTLLGDALYRLYQAPERTPCCEVRGRLSDLITETERLAISADGGGKFKCCPFCGASR